MVFESVVILKLESESGCTKKVTYVTKIFCQKRQSINFLSKKHQRLLSSCAAYTDAPALQKIVIVTPHQQQCVSNLVDAGDDDLQLAYKNCIQYTVYTLFVHLYYSYSQTHWYSQTITDRQFWLPIGLIGLKVSKISSTNQLKPLWIVLCCWERSLVQTRQYQPDWSG